MWSGKRQPEKPQSPAAKESGTAIPHGMALVPIEQVPDSIADTRPPVDQIRSATGSHDSEKLMELRERATKLEVQFQNTKSQQDGHTTELKEIADFHKSLKTTAKVVGVIIIGGGGFLSWLFSGDIHAARVMLDDYEYCEQHREDADKTPDCIVAPRVDKKPSVSTSNAAAN